MATVPITAVNTPPGTAPQGWWSVAISNEATTLKGPSPQSQAEELHEGALAL
ncbi:MAG: hypothetical protein M3315_09520 [Actinomycetota bacterium]|nr:hypothetical protein [Actinomycetota bacterium]